MTVLVVSTLVFALTIAAMSVDVMAGRQSLKDSCGGSDKLLFAGTHEVFGRDNQRREQNTGTTDAGDRNRFPARSVDE